MRALGYEVEIELAGLMLFVLNDDRPGMIGTIGTLLGEAGVNVANMNVSRNREGGMALSAIQVDGDVPQATLGALRATPGPDRPVAVSGRAARSHGTMARADGGEDEVASTAGAEARLAA